MNLDYDERNNFPAGDVNAFLQNAKERIIAGLEKLRLNTISELRRSMMDCDNLVLTVKMDNKEASFNLYDGVDFTDAQREIFNSNPLGKEPNERT